MNELSKTKCWGLARELLTDIEIDKGLSIAQVTADINSLTEAIQKTVEDWLSANPIDEHPLGSG